ncbi:protein phosphatase 1 regulatory subunit 15B [Erpetoichthys calabaricus]|uniref:Protein phosphatase 1 regulatory subunit 15B n=1 Tax=Erpetoichthys calabaricus TaxID=27687 RepID=A0A8C4X5D9_ERPCA|nr:protein phosphatase 1 regulatory subunit 15B [Erpetoichthys calabaricus]
METNGLYTKQRVTSFMRSEEQENSWIGTLTALVTRPSLLLQRYFPTWTGVGSVCDFRKAVPGQDRSPPLSLVHCQHGDDLLSESTSLGWFNAQALQEVGLMDLESTLVDGCCMKKVNHSQNPPDGQQIKREPAAACGYVSAVRKSLNQEWLHMASVMSAQSSQLMTPNLPVAVSKTCVGHSPLESSAKWSWWASLWGWTDYGKPDPDEAQNRDERHLLQSLANDSHNQLLCGENTGCLSHNRQADNSSTEAALPQGFCPEKPQLDQTLVCRIAASSEVFLLTPDQDNGYSSLEEEHSAGKLAKMDPCTRAEVVIHPCCTQLTDLPDEFSVFGSDKENLVNEAVTFHPAEETAQCVTPADTLPSVSKPQCQNKMISYIIGGYCSSESSSEDSDVACSEEDDDGFDSDSSSVFSDSDEENSPERENLLGFFSQSSDPYNLQNFTATIQSAKPSNPSEEQENSNTDEGSEEESSLGSSSSEEEEDEEKEETDSEDDQSSCDEEENLKLWNYFSCGKDPYSPFNFQGPIRTKKARQNQTPLSSCQAANMQSLICHNLMKGPLDSYSLETPSHEEDRLDSGFYEAICSMEEEKEGLVFVKRKKVTFSVEVEEFYTSCDEDRHGPWEELARDRCRFLRRIQETEDSIGYCLSAAHRELVLQRLLSK